MSDAIALAKLYFELSNQSDMDAIEALMTDATTYSSVNTGVYLGRTQIMAMQRNFHSSFESLHWEVLAVKEVRPGVVLCDFVFKAKDRNGNQTSKPGDEYVVVADGKLAHVEVRNKPNPNPEQHSE